MHSQSLSGPLDYNITRTLLRDIFLLGRCCASFSTSDFPPTEKKKISRNYFSH